QLLAFPTDAAEGTYNAVLAQLDPSLPLLDYRIPFDANASTSLAPPMWISAVGGTSLVPLAALPVSASGGHVTAPHLLRQKASTTEKRNSGTREEVPLGAPMPLVMVLWGALSASIVRVLWGARKDLTTVVRPLDPPTPPVKSKGLWRAFGAFVG